MADVFAYLEGFGVSGGSPNKSTIIVTAPTGSTVTCKMGSTTKTAAEKNGVWTFGGLDLGTWTITSTKGGDSATQDVSITRLTVEYVTIVYRITPEFTYTGDYEIVDDSDNAISDFANWKSGWKIRFLTSGTFTVTNFYGWNGRLDVFLVGGGGGVNWGSSTTGGAGSGYTTTGRIITIELNTPYTIDIGAGGVGATDGGTTSAFDLTANGGKHPTSSSGGAGGSGGGGYVHASASGTSATHAGNGGSDGSNGFTAGSGGGDGGTGQGTTTREFGDSSGKLYAGGGAGASNKGSVTPVGGEGGGGDPGNDGATNTGGGAGNKVNGGKHTGGSGIVVVRNTRGAA